MAVGDRWLSEVLEFLGNEWRDRWVVRVQQRVYRGVFHGRLCGELWEQAGNGIIYIVPRVECIFFASK